MSKKVIGWKKVQVRNRSTDEWICDAILKLEVRGSVVTPHERAYVAGEDVPGAYQNSTGDDLNHTKYGGYVHKLRTDLVKVLAAYKVEHYGEEVVGKLKLKKGEGIFAAYGYFQPYRGRHGLARFEYKRNRLARPVGTFTTDPDVGCGPGIHYFANKAHAIGYSL